MARNTDLEIRALRLQIEQLNKQLAHVDGRLRELESDQGPSPEISEPLRTTPPPVPKKTETEALIPTKRAPIEEREIPPREVEPELKPAASVDSDSPKNAAKPSKPPAEPGDWEMQLGRVWFVRIGMLLFLTGLVFLSTYAYQNYIFDASAATKFGLFLALSLGLTVMGFLLERANERFKQYGQVVSAGGLAAAYYTFYAAHFTPALKIIDSPILAGTVLTGWAALMLGYATLRRSRVVAVMALGFAFYGTVVNPSGAISLFSSLLLSAASMFLLLRFKWVWVGLATVVASYLSHAFWLGYVGQPVSESVRLMFLASYWALFSVSLATVRARQLPEKIQKAICSLNNSAAWALIVFQIPSFTPHERLGWISLGLGALWIALAALTRWKSWWAAHLTPIWAFQGLAIATLGLATEATGFNRFMLLGVEACLLLFAARHFGGNLSRAASITVYAISLSLALTASTAGWLPYAAYATVLAIYSLLVRREIGLLSPEGNSQEPTKYDSLCLTAAAIFWMSLATKVLGKLELNAALPVGSSLVGFAVILGFGSRFARLFKDIALSSLVFAALWGITLSGQTGQIAPLSFIPAALVAFLLWHLTGPILASFGTYLQAENPPPELDNIKWVFSSLFWLMLASCFGFFLGPQTHWLWTGGLLAMAGTAALKTTGQSSIGIPALFLHLISLAALQELGYGPAYLSIIPVALCGIHLAWIDWKIQTPLKRVILNGLGVLLAVQSFNSILLIFRTDSSVWILSLSGLVLTFWALRRQIPALFLTAVLVHLFGASIISSFKSDSGFFIGYLPVVSALLAHAALWKSLKLDHLGWRFARGMALIVGAIPLVAHATENVMETFKGSGVAIIWGLLAIVFFTLGLTLKHRAYRWAGLALIAMALGHIAIIDVMKLKTLGRILSFMGLGVVLLSLGYLYNRFHEKIRELL